MDDSPRGTTGDPAGVHRMDRSTDAGNAGDMRSAKSDANQAAIFQALRQAGAVVTDTHRLGDGFPDCSVLFRGCIHLVEIKVPGGKLTKLEQKWHDMHADCDYVHIVESIAEAFYAVGATVI